ncbi:hypothetical protein Pan44_41890 [Caulifigura coniformis]|uniref:Uncharacterized protein n=2 Tax=Caulifigura coniformis TaxID=2527983 RepID=A0A517SJ28_9PLAN|nr:hypothetical protein Pan44_41890 [Caulifigura coniformis]
MNLSVRAGRLSETRFCEKTNCVSQRNGRSLSCRSITGAPPIATECKPCLLSDEDRQRVRPYLIAAGGAYLGAFAISTIVVLCNCFGVFDSGRYIMAFALLPALVRYLVVYPISRKTAAMTGQPVPSVSIVGYLILFAFLGLYLSTFL